MPYITLPRREFLKPKLHPLCDYIAHGNDAITPGDMNYIITRLLLAYLKHAGVSYTTLNCALGILTCVKHEFYRRAVADYEEGKIVQNGDVYGAPL